MLEADAVGVGGGLREALAVAVPAATLPEAHPEGRPLALSLRVRRGVGVSESVPEGEGVTEPLRLALPVAEGQRDAETLTEGERERPMEALIVGE